MTPRPARTFVYVPYVDEQATGMQRFSSEMVQALGRTSSETRLLVGEIHGRPAWLEGVPHMVVLGAWWAARLPRPLAALARAAWVQLVFPVIAGRGATLLALAHEVAPLPLVRQVAVVHDMTDFKAYAGRGGLGTRVRNSLWRAGLRRSAAVIAISDATRRDLAATLGITGDRVSVVYEGVDRSRFRPRPDDAPPERPFLLHVGTLDPHKNIPFLLSVHAELVARGHAVDLVCAGRYTAAQTDVLTSELPDEATARIRWAGFVDDTALADLLASCTAFVFPSRNEGFGLAAAEAMACGAPVVSSEAGSLAEVVGEGGVLLDPDDHSAWVAELEHVLTDSAYREALAARALARADAFSWDRAARAYEAILNPAR